jgi:hypothetical protein
MSGHGGVAAFERGARMAGHPFALMEYFHDVLGEPYVELMAHQSVRDRVIMPLHVYVRVDVDTRSFPLGVLIRDLRQNNVPARLAMPSTSLGLPGISFSRKSLSAIAEKSVILGLV